MLPSFKELIVKKNHPLRMHELPNTVSHKWVTWGFPASSLLGGEILKVPRKLFHTQ
jgi:hypothetical protein